MEHIALPGFRLRLQAFPAGYQLLPAARAWHATGNHLLQLRRLLIAMRGIRSHRPAGNERRLRPLGAGRRMNLAPSHRHDAGVGGGLGALPSSTPRASARRIRPSTIMLPVFFQVVV